MKLRMIKAMSREKDNMVKGRGRIALAACAAALALMNVSFRWPVDNAIITSTFGESRWDHFHDGMDVISPDRKVYPVAEGKLVYYWNRARFPLDNYPGMGNFRVIDHGNSMLGIYGHLGDDAAVRTVFTPGEPLGFMGNTGHSMAAHLHFTLVKAGDNKSINPLGILPPVNDARPPVHLGTYLRIGDRYIPLRGKTNYRLTQHYPLLLEINDTILGRERLGIYKLSVTLNDRKVLDVEFAEINSAKNILTLQGMASEDLFDEKGYYRVAGVKYAEGENRVKVVALDYSGNRMESDLAFMVNLDIK
jgi:hypothetical protein